MRCRPERWPTRRAGLRTRRAGTRTAAIRRADAWIRSRPVKSVLDAAAVLLSLEKAADDKAASQRRDALAVLRMGESKEGGWGPFVNSSAEPFDTALVVLALTRQRETA